MICFWHGAAGGDRHKNESGEKRTALRDSVARVCRTGLPKFTGPVSVRLFMVLDPRTDAQALIEPCLGALEQAGVIESDRQVRHFSFYRETAPESEKDSIGIAVTAVKTPGRKSGGKRKKSAGKPGDAHPGRRGSRRLQVPAGA